MISYLHSSPDAHWVCSKCPDADEVRKAFESIEEKKYIRAMENGVWDHMKRRVVMTLCNTCIDSIENSHILDPENDT